MSPGPDLQDFIALSLTPPWRWRAAIDLFRSGVTPRDVLDRLLVQRDDVAPSLSANRLRVRAGAAIGRANAAGLAPITLSDRAYPSALAAIVDPPFVLWTRGPTDVLHQPAVAIVGSRAGSPYALAVAERLAADLASRGIVIVSGLARGVDSAAHRGALQGGGSTVAVLGSGADRVYPSEHAALAVQIQRTGVVASELAPGTPPLPHFFPLRNRIISGLARAVVVIEAGEKSGSLITARLALEQGRDVLAVPGNVLSGRNRGAHALLRDGARIVETADDVVDELGLTIRVGDGSRLAADRLPSAASRDPVLGCFSVGEVLDFDEIAERSGLRPARLLPRLLELELGGLVARAGGGRFVRS